MVTIPSQLFEMFTVQLLGEHTPLVHEMFVKSDRSSRLISHPLRSSFSAVTTVHQSEFHFVKRSSSEDSPLEMNNALHHPGQPFAHVDGETQDSNTIEKSYIDPTGFRARGTSAASNGTRVVHPEVVYGQSR